MIAYLTAFCMAALAIWQTRTVRRKRAVLGLFATAGIMLLLAAIVWLLTRAMSDVRVALLLAAGFGLAGAARLFLRSGA
ncbi:MAG TPA: hypothetical protein VGD52_08215 [Pseudoduganella sp.]